MWGSVGEEHGMERRAVEFVEDQSLDIVEGVNADFVLLSFMVSNWYPENPGGSGTFIIPGCEYRV